ncbi:MAG: MBL fold metallo-hydrolase [Bacteroidota bacterium]|nr:MBL fold metallo-hydrolase [Bacteroidota bacterium]
MKITFLGTGTSQGIPMIGCTCNVCQSVDYRDQRLRSSIHIQNENDSIVIDSGPDFRQQILRARIKTLDAVLFTHEHKDHVAGLDDVRGFNYSQNRPMQVYAHQRVLNHIKEREFYYAFGEFKYPGAPELEVNEIKNAPFKIKNTEFIPIEVLHYRLPVFGFRIKNFTYITDASFISDIEIEKIKGSEIVVLNGLQKEAHISHFTLQQSIEMLNKIAPKRAYLTHISHKLGLHRIVQKELPEGVELSYDGLEIIV